MTNPLTGIITQEFKNTWNNAIDALLESSALTELCRLIYGSTKHTQCPNCILDTISRCSANIYNGTGPSPFPNNSICPMCGGIGFITSESSDDISMAVIRDVTSIVRASRFVFTDIGVRLDANKRYILTISMQSTFPLIQKAQRAILNINIEGYNGDRYERLGDAVLVAFGGRPYTVAVWERVI